MPGKKVIILSCLRKECVIGLVGLHAAPLSTTKPRPKPSIIQVADAECLDLHKTVSAVLVGEVDHCLSELPHNIHLNQRHALALQPLIIVGRSLSGCREHWTGSTPLLCHFHTRIISSGRVIPASTVSFSS